MIYAYCIRAAGQPGPPGGLPGVGGERVGLVEEGELAMWISRVGGALPATPDRLREHDRVVREALRTATPLPVRYGTGAFADEEVARAALRERADELVRSLERVAGRVEMGIRLDWEAPPVEAAAPPAAMGAETGPGRAYLEARRQDLRRADSLRGAAGDLLGRVEAQLGLEGVPAARTLLPAPGTAAILAHLVLRSELGPYRDRVEEVRRTFPEHPISLSGPWAPYSFV